MSYISVLSLCMSIVCWLLQLEVATGKFPYRQWKNLFDQIKQVVEGPPPQLPSGLFSQQFEDFIRLWSVDIVCRLWLLKILFDVLV